MNYKKIITMPTYNRPEYTRQVLEGMRRCHGIKDYTIYVFAEPGYQEVIDVINDMKNKGLNIELTINEKRLGLPANTRQCLDTGFGLTDYLIHFEDDIVPSKDCLKYFEWARDTYENDKDVFSVCGHTKVDKFENKKDLYHAVFRHRWFFSIAWATWIDRWEEIKANWTETGPELARTSWSDSAQKARKNRHVIIPYLSRTQYVGIENPTHKSEAHIKIGYNEFWVDSVDFDDKRCDFYETDNKI